MRFKRIAYIFEKSKGIFEKIMDRMDGIIFNAVFLSVYFLALSISALAAA